MHILIVDDEKEIRDTIQEYLELNGCKITQAENAETARSLVAGEDEFDLALLDITMPGEDGLSLARYLRESTDLALVMLTASGEVIDRIVGLEMGADDYIAKPVDLRELLARIKAVLGRNRINVRSRPASGPATQRIDFGRCQLDIDAHKLFSADGEEIAITAMEFDLLKALAERPNRVLSRDQLLQLAHNRSWDPFDRSIDIRIARLRRKLECDPAKPQVIKTVRGAGYMFSPPKR
jgi:two-component system phosphate regulon response regulator OmpR